MMSFHFLNPFRNHCKTIRRELLAGIFIVVMLVGTRGTVLASLPERPDGISTTPQVDSTDPAPDQSARIVLTANGFALDDWTVVQWQGTDGAWHDVTGWQGTLLLDGTVLWWVGSDQLGQENFRWLVFEDATRTTLKATSETFDLPATSDGVVPVEISAE